ncbi:hypothetical protein MGYG_05005 [Paecilomyces variotii No. 5]|uniref:Uncharacterized protein n=1 Tax=Byssochlamys spectabilis (strain No. 5 / NBRC 109023) TaxID=1356009 RepID=V5G189_BYSSN|nr:hypothetical protein MGYG_05005 [Paecilomyces variotii No. 5]
MQPSQEEILAALGHYRDRIRQHNRVVFERFVQHAEAAKPQKPMGAHRISEARQKFMYNLLYVSRPEMLNPALRINEPADVLANWDDFVQTFGLDGVYIHRTDHQEQLRAAYKSGIEAGLRRIESDVGFPTDFDVLMGHVDSLNGHGWPKYRAEGQQVRFWDGTGESQDEVADRVYGGDDALLDKTGLNYWDGPYGWKVAAGWECGMGPETTCFVVYCQHEESGKEWAWRYVAERGQYGVDVFDNVVEMLQWYEILYMPPLDDRLDCFMSNIF